MVLINPSDTKPRHIKDYIYNQYKPIFRDEKEEQNYLKQQEREKGIEEFIKKREEAEREAKQQYKAEMLAKYNTTSWDVVKQQKQKEYEERCEQRKQREKEKAEWWEKNKDRIQAERERRHEEYLDRKAERSARSREAAGKPIPGAWRTANRPDGW